MAERSRLLRLARGAASLGKVSGVQTQAFKVSVASLPDPSARWPPGSLQRVGGCLQLQALHKILQNYVTLLVPSDEWVESDAFSSKLGFDYALEYDMPNIYSIPNYL